MKRLMVGILLAVSSSTASAAVTCPDLSTNQKVVLQKSWKYGEEKVGKGWGVKLASVAYQESKLGKDIHGQGSYGVYQLKPSTAAYMNGQKTTKGVRKRLTNEFQYSAISAAKYLTYWKDKGYSDYNMYRAYNGGYVKNKATKVYAASVQKHVHTFKQCYVYNNGVLHERS
ncbi:lysin [Yersinia phage vB_YenM_P778]